MSAKNEIPYDFRGCVDESEQSSVLWTKQSGSGAFFQWQNERRRELSWTSRRSSALSGYEKAADPRRIDELDVAAGRTAHQMMILPKRQLENLHLRRCATRVPPVVVRAAVRCALKRG